MPLLSFLGTPKQILAAGVFFALLFATSRYLGERYLYVAYSAVTTFAVFGLLAYMRFVGLALAGVFLLGAAMQVAYRAHFGENMSVGVLQSIAETNPHEMEAMSGLVLTLLRGAIVPFAALLLAFLYFRKNKTGAMLGAALAVSLVSTVVLWPLPIDQRFILDVENYPAILGERYRRINNLVFGDLSVISTTFATDMKYAGGHAKVNDPSILGHDKPVSPVIVVVVGESSLVSRYGLYGYDVDTTPNLTRLAAGKKFCAVKNVHSASPITRNSLSMTFSFRSPESFTALLDTKSIIDLAKEAGFESYWIASQPLRGSNETEYGFLAKDSDHIWFTDGEDNELPDLLAKALKEPQANDEKFIVLHMAGSHWPYSRRFDEIDQKALPAGDDYDRSIHKTDRVLASVIQELKDSRLDYTLLYFSDHGEIIGKGHGVSGGGPSQYLIPYIADYSDASNEVCAFIESMRNGDGYFSALSNKFVLLKLLGYRVDPAYVASEVGNDRVLHSDGLSHPWSFFLNETVDRSKLTDLK